MTARRRCERRFGLPLIAFVGCCLLATQVNARVWTDSARAGNLVYLLATAPPSVERYDMAQQTWLPSIVLSATPTSFTVDEEGLYIAYGTRVVRLDLDGTNEVLLWNTSNPVRDCVTAGRFLFLFVGAHVISVDKLIGGAIHETDFFYSMTGVSAAPTGRALLGRSANASPPTIVLIRFDESGHLIEQTDPLTHLEYPDATRTWILPDQARVVDNAGTIYQANDLRFAASLGGNFDGIDFFGDLPIVLRGSTLTAYSNAFRETGHFTLPSIPTEIHVYENSVYTFRPGTADTVHVGTVAIELLSPAKPGELVDPHGLAFEADDIELGRDGTVYLLHSGLLSLFRWSVASRDYLQTIPLSEGPTTTAYASDGNLLYLAFPGGRIREIHLDESTLEHPFATASEEIRTIVAAGSYLFVSPLYGYAHFVYGADGEIRSEGHRHAGTAEITWSPAARKGFYLREGITPNDLMTVTISVDGVLGLKRETPLHTDEPFQPPIRVSPDGAIAVLGSGAIFDTEDLELIDRLPNHVSDSAWVYDTLFTLRDIDPDSQVQEWADGFNMPSSFFRIPGRPIALLGFDGLLLAITSVDGVPTFSLHDNLVPSPTPTGTATSTSTTTATPTVTPTFTITPTATASATSSASPTATPTSTPRACPGDCDGGGWVTLAELVAAVRLALQPGDAAPCRAADPDEDGTITVAELILAVRSALTACPPADRRIHPQTM